MAAVVRAMTGGAAHAVGVVNAVNVVVIAADVVGMIEIGVPMPVVVMMVIRVSDQSTEIDIASAAFSKQTMCCAQVIQPTAIQQHLHFPRSS